MTRIILLGGVYIRDLDTPADGATPDTEATVHNNILYGITDIIWIDNTTGEEATKFIGGRTYEVNIFVAIKEDGYVFATDSAGNTKTVAEINNEKAQVTSISGVSQSLALVIKKEYTCSGDDSRNIVLSPMLYVNRPIAGQNPDFSSSVGDSEKYEIVSISWRLKGTVADLTKSDIFKAGQDYTVIITVAAKPGYRFGNGIEFYTTEPFVNGERVSTPNGKVNGYALTDRITTSYTFENLSTVYFTEIGATAKLSKTSYTYTGSACKPTITVAGLIKDRDFTVKYSSNTSVGKATVTVTGIGNYEGTLEKTFTIKPKQASISSITVGSRKMTVKAKTKVSSTGGKYYEINYRVKGASTWKKAKTTAQSLTISKLTKGKYYQVRIRAYKVVGSTTYYGSWSTTKTSAKIK